MEKGTIVTLAIASLISMAISIGDLFFEFESLPYLKDSSQITLFVVGILCLVALGERVTIFRQLTSEMSQLRKDLSSTLPAQYLTTSATALADIKEIASDAEHVISVLFYSTHIEGPLAAKWEEYTKTVVQLLREREDLEYRIVFGCKESEPTERERQWLEERVGRLATSGLAERIHYRYKRIPVGFFLYTVDNQHAIIGFSNTSELLVPKNMVKVSGKHQFISSLNRWYEKHVWGEAFAVSERKSGASKKNPVVRLLH